ARERLIDRVEFHEFCQLLFFEQWIAVRERARALGIAIMGDIAIFVAHDSADVWAHQRQFKLDDQGRPLVVAGVPPDYFSATGQLWGNPLYDWDAMADDGETPYLNPYLPHNYPDPNCVVYTGTHDNNTTRGWLASLSEFERAYLTSYMGKDRPQTSQELIRLALSSTANTVIVPLQDV